jgi:DNA-binding transcriptional ArsR family regulator
MENIMSLQDILGKTAEIRIIDFMAENYGNSYTQWELYELTGISRTVLYKKLPALVKKGILEINGQVGRYKAYRLADNEIVNKLITLVHEYNLIEAGKPEDEETREPESEPMVPTENRYYKDPGIVPDDYIIIPSKAKKWLPLEYEDTGKSQYLTAKIDTQDQTYCKEAITGAA